MFKSQRRKKVKTFPGSRLFQAKFEKYSKSRNLPVKMITRNFAQDDRKLLHTNNLLENSDFIMKSGKNGGGKN